MEVPDSPGRIQTATSGHLQATAHLPGPFDWCTMMRHRPFRALAISEDNRFAAFATLRHLGAPTSITWSMTRSPMLTMVGVQPPAFPGARSAVMWNTTRRPMSMTGVVRLCKGAQTPPRSALRDMITQWLPSEHSVGSKRISEPQNIETET